AMMNPTNPTSKIPAPAIFETCENSSVVGVVAIFNTLTYEVRSYGTSISVCSHSTAIYLSFVLSSIVDRSARRRRGAVVGDRTACIRRPRRQPDGGGTALMAEDDTDRADELAAEREAEIVDELERIGRDPDEVDE